MLEEDKYYVYRHIRLDKNEPFYIGIGTKRPASNSNTLKSIYYRAFTKKSRGIIWKNIINKTDFKVEILMESKNYEFIKEKEIEFIKLYGRKDKNEGCLANRTDGGDGSTGIVYTKKHRLKLSEGQINSDKTMKKGDILPQWWRGKISEAVTGENNHMYGRTGKKHPMSKRVINIETKEVYNSIGEAAETTRHSMKYLSGMLNNDKNNLTPFIFEDTFNEKGYEYCKSKCNMKPKINKSNSKKVENTLTGKVYNSAKELAELLGVHPVTIRKKIKKGTINYRYI